MHLLLDISQSILKQTLVNSDTLCILGDTKNCKLSITLTLNSKGWVATCMISRTRYSTSVARAGATSGEKFEIPMLCAMTSIVSLGTMLIFQFSTMFHQFLAVQSSKYTSKQISVIYETLQKNSASINKRKFSANFNRQ